MDRNENGGGNDDNDDGHAHDGTCGGCDDDWIACEDYADNDIYGEDDGVLRCALCAFNGVKNYDKDNIF